jgi:hypothetical protein
MASTLNRWESATSAVRMFMPRLHRVLPLALALSALVAGTACAPHGYYRHPSPRAFDDRAYDHGYEDGRRHGEGDARRGRSYDYDRHRDFRSADDGYRGYGSRNGYRQDYRQGFATGYDEGYRRHARGYRGQRPSWNGRGPYSNGGRRDAAVYRSPAGEHGYRDGYEQGRDDGGDGDRYDPVRAERYRSGDHDYDSRYGPREDYKREYRAAFQQGYDQGYREVRRR